MSAEDEVRETFNKMALEPDSVCLVALKDSDHFVEVPYEVWDVLRDDERFRHGVRMTGMMAGD